jgi:hypothetical protein
MSRLAALFSARKMWVIQNRTRIWQTTLFPSGGFMRFQRPERRVDPGRGHGDRGAWAMVRSYALYTTTQLKVTYTNG